MQTTPVRAPTSAWRQNHRREPRATAAAVEHEITRDRAVPFACAGLPLGRIAPHDPHASPGAPYGHTSRAHCPGVTHLHGVTQNSLLVVRGLLTSSSALSAFGELVLLLRVGAGCSLCCRRHGI